MSQVGIVRENAILPFTAAMDLTGHEGRPVIADTNTEGNPVSLSDDPGGTVPIGVLVKGGKEGETVSVAIASGGLAGTVRIKLAAAVGYAGENLKLGLLEGYCAFVPTTASGERIVMAQNLEPGVAGEKVEAVLYKPELYLS